MTIWTLFDWGAGNLHSLEKALARSGADVRVEADPVVAAEAVALVLPGVGAFGPAAARLAPVRERLRARLLGGLPCIGVCLGMQMLFDASEEGPGQGLGIFPGAVTRLRARQVPHMGWSTLEDVREPALEGLDVAYFAHGFACRLEDPSLARATTEHEGDRFPSAVRRGRVVGVQFHPEKSSRTGVEALGRLARELSS